MNMARKEVLVQLDDALVARLDDLGERLGLSRSELLRRGAAAVLEAADLLEAYKGLVEAYRARPQDSKLVKAAARLARTTTPEW